MAATSTSSTATATTQKSSHFSGFKKGFKKLGRALSMKKTATPVEPLKNAENEANLTASDKKHLHSISQSLNEQLESDASDAPEKAVEKMPSFRKLPPRNSKSSLKNNSQNSGLSKKSSLRKNNSQKSTLSKKSSQKSFVSPPVTEATAASIAMASVPQKKVPFSKRPKVVSAAPPRDITPQPVTVVTASKAVTERPKLTVIKTSKHNSISGPPPTAKNNAIHCPPPLPPRANTSPMPKTAAPASQIKAPPHPHIKNTLRYQLAKGPLRFHRFESIDNKIPHSPAYNNLHKQLDAPASQRALKNTSPKSSWIPALNTLFRLKLVNSDWLQQKLPTILNIAWVLVAVGNTGNLRDLAGHWAPQAYSWHKTVARL